MKSILRFLVVMALVFGATLLWRTDTQMHFAAPAPSKGVNPHEEVERALRPLRTAPVVKTWSREIYQSRLDEAFRRNDPCSVVALLQEEASVAPETRLAAGMQTILKRSRDSQPVLEELFAENSPLLGKPFEESRRPETRFLNALVYSNQLMGYDSDANHPHRNSHRNTERAVEILRELEQEDPANGAYSYFLAHALRQGGAKKEEVEAAYVQAAKAARFDTFYQAAFDTLQGLAYDNLATFAWVYTYLKGAPVPDFGSGTRNLRSWASNSDTGKWIANRLAKRLIDTGTRNKNESPGYLYSPMEYILGYNLRYTVGGLPEKSWEEYTDRMKEVRAFIGETPPAVDLAEIELYKSLFSGSRSGGGDCSFSTWQSLFEAYKSKRAGA